MLESCRKSRMSRSSLKSIPAVLCGLLFLYLITLLLPGRPQHLQNWIINRYQATATVSALPDSRFYLKKNQDLKLTTTKYFDFVISEGEGSPDGVLKHMLLVNNRYPGPTIELEEGDEVVVKVTNHLNEPAVIHWHGIPQTLTPYFDGVFGITQCGIPVGETLEYRFGLDGWTGTTWYHAHYGSQRLDGISGAFIVHAKNESTPYYDEDVVLQLSDVYHSFSTSIVEKYLSPLGMVGVPGDEPVPDGASMNGVGQRGTRADHFSFSFMPNLTYRIRLINTGAFAPFIFSIDGHSLLVVEADGVLVQPYSVRSLKIMVAQRYSILVTLDQPTGAYWMRATLSPEMFRYENPNLLNTTVFGIIRYGSDNSVLPDSVDEQKSTSLEPFDEYSLIPLLPETPPEATLTYLVKVTSQRTSDGKTLMFFNSTSWEPPFGTFNLDSMTGFVTTGSQVIGEQLIVNIPSPSSESKGPQVVDIIIQNFDDSGHPFHIHGKQVYVIGKGAGRYDGRKLESGFNPMRRDTIFIPDYHWVALRFVADTPGIFAFHCHVAWHLASGLLMQFINMAEELKKIEIPSILLDQCKRL